MHKLTPLSGTALRAGLLCALLSPIGLHAQSAQGTISGRVVNGGTGDVLVRAKVKLVDTNIETFTDEFGQFTLPAPAGPQQLHVSYTGLPDRTISTEVRANETTFEEIKIRANFTPAAKNASGDEVFELDAFEIRERKETNGLNIAANEQRYSPNIKSVVSSEAFGDVTEGNVGEFIKYLPGISVDYVAADVRTINVRGFSSAFTNVSVNGMRLTSSVSGSNNRAIELEQISLSNVARAEVVKVPTPDSPADSLGGNVNLVSKNAFERDGRSFNYRAYLSVNSENVSLRKSPGPKDRESAKALPGFDFDLTLPFTKNFGIVLTGISSNQYNEQHRTQNTWNHAQAGATETNPYLQSYLVQDGPKVTFRNAISLRADWRVRPGTTVTFGYQNNLYSNFFGNRNTTFNVGTTATSSTTGGVPLSWSSSKTEGATGRGTISQGSSYRAKNGQTQAGDVYIRHKTADWELDLGLHAAKSRTWYNDLEDGHFSGVSTTMQGVSRVRFDGIEYPRPQTIEAFDASGNKLNYSDLSNYRVTQVGSTPIDGFATMKGVLGNVKRSLRLGSIPIALKTGFTARQEVRDNRRFTNNYTFLGADGVANTADNAARPFLSEGYNMVSPHYGLPGLQWASPWKLASLFRSSPNQFVETNVAASSTTAGQAAGVPNYIAAVQNSIRIKEDTSAAYIQFESKFLNNKLNLITGVRFEQTKDDGFGFKADPDIIFERNADGTFKKDGTGKRIRKAEAGPAGAANSVGTMLTLQEARMIYVERGYNAKSKQDGYYPSLHLSYDITDQLIARFAYAKTFGRPDFADIVPNTTIDENETFDPANPSSNPGTITTSNTGLKPWAADNWDLSLEYYYTKTGSLSAGVFRKDISDFWGNVTGVSLTPELANELGLDPRYTGWRVTSKKNVGDARISGLELNWVQPLEFLGAYGKYFNLTANGTFLRLEGSNEADFKRFISRAANAGLTYSKYPLKIMAKVNFRGKQRLDPQTGAAYQGTATPAGGTIYEWEKARATIDLNLDYSLSKKVALFANVRNLMNVPQQRERFNTATPEYAINFQAEEYGLQWAVGVKGSF